MTVGGVRIRWQDSTVIDRRYKPEGIQKATKNFNFSSPAVAGPRGDRELGPPHGREAA
jgi:hypothetical protein